MNSIDTEKAHLKSMNKIFSYLLLLHIPAAITLGHIFETGVIFAIIGSLLISSLPILLSVSKNSHKLASISHGIALMFYSGLLIHLSRGMIEAHFHIFVCIAILIVFAQPLVILAAAGTIAVHHVAFFFFLPQSVFNYEASLGILVIHAAMVVFQTLPCTWIAKKFNYYIIQQGMTVTQINSIYAQIREEITKLKSANESLAHTSTIQSNAVLKTSEAVNEIEKIAAQNTENAIASKNISEQTNVSAHDGTQNIYQINEAITLIKDSNLQMMKEIEMNNKELEELVTLIKEIEQKTGLINDIVFQTKLLSFNASVEAARAGEQGKGFSVVADEIGKLAANSGVASKEINNIIELGIEKALHVINKSQVRVHEISDSSHKSISSGEEKVIYCAEKFTELNSFIENLNHNVIEISEASKEQSEGILSMSQIISELESVNTTNAEKLRDSVQVSHKLTELSNELGDLVSKLSIG